MPGRGRGRIHKTAGRITKVLRTLVLLTVFCVIIKLAAGAGLDTKAQAFFSDLIGSDSFVAQLLSVDLASPTVKDATAADAALAALMSESSHLSSGAEEVEAHISYEEPDDTPQESAPVTQDEDKSEESPIPTISPSSDIIETTITGEGHSGYTSSEGIYINNKTGYEIDIDALMSEELKLSVDVTQPQILIIHTHGSEAFTPDGDDIYTETDPSRTEDKNYNVIRLGDALTEALESRGISVIHDRELYDYPSYSGSYPRALDAIKAYLAEYPEIKIVIDLHRDALVGSDGTVYKTVAEVDGETCAQVMMIMGSDYTGLHHPNWRENLKFALQLQAAMNDKYPALARPLTISEYRYNQHATTGSMILEVGCSGNTLQEALKAIEHFADSAADVILSLAE